MVETGPVDVYYVPINRVYKGVDTAPFRFVDMPGVGRQKANLMVLQVDDPFGVTDESCRVTGQEVLSLSQAKDERAAQAGADDQPRVPGADHG